MISNKFVKGKPFMTWEIWSIEESKI